MRAIVLFFLFAGTLSIQTSVFSKEKQLHVVNTIKPVQALVIAIARDKVNSEQLIPDFSSPHFYSFKPSDLRKINQADIVFRIDKSMEMMLNPAFENLNSKTKVISLTDSKGLKLIPVSQKHSESHVSQDAHADRKEENGQHKGEEGDHHDHSSHDEYLQAMDMHIWTSPENAIAMAKQIAHVLGETDSKNKSFYDTNLSLLIRDIKSTSLDLESALKTLKNKPYIVFHDSWQYFSQYYGLKKSTVVSLHEGIAPGAKTLPRIRKQIKSNHVHCLFSKPGMNASWIDALTEDMENVKTVEIDVIASTLKMNDQLYINWLKHMGKQVASCLATK